MAVWLVRAGKHGQFEQKFLQESRVYVTWTNLDVNLAELEDRTELVDAMAERYPANKSRAISNYASQVWPFAHEMKEGDLVILPLKEQRAIQIGEITGDYKFNPKGPSPYFHWRSVRWIAEAIPRSNFGKDLLNSFGAFMTICRIQRNNAETRLAAMRANGWKAEKLSSIVQSESPAVADLDVEGQDTDLEELAMDKIAQLVMARFKGHGLARLVEAVLKAQGYMTYRSPEGADGGADILAGSGELGFGSPRICVEVKSEASPIDRSTVDKLLGAMTKFGAQEGLFVSWSGFKSNVQKELAGSFFRLRLWSQSDLLEALFANYGKLDPDIRAEMPLKQIWTVAAQDED